MQAAEILDTISAAGGLLWLEGDRVRARLPESLRPLVDAIRERKPEIIELLGQRPTMPVRVRLVAYAPVQAPVRVSPSETVIDTGKFIESTLQQIESRLYGKNWLSGNLPLSGLVERLALVGCVVELTDKKIMLQ